MKEAVNKEWLVTDQRGAFAMGTPEGSRKRKYHGFFAGIAGRSQTAFLTDLDFDCNGVSLWPHSYQGPEGLVIHPDPHSAGISMEYKLRESGPQWKWSLKEGVLKFSVEPAYPGGILLHWRWLSNAKSPAYLRVRGFWGMRDLHSVGGQLWEWNPLLDQQKENKSQIVQIQNKTRNVYCMMRGGWTWNLDPKWYHHFYYLDEVERGYPATEDLYSSGFTEIQLNPGESCDWIIAEDRNDLTEVITLHKRSRAKIFDFVLTRPAGIIAGLPWFGEWGRDTFISLPGIAASAIKLGNDPAGATAWTNEILHRWGTWIERSGMLPNLIEKEGQVQWESADATLWWCHTLACLWMFSLCPPHPFVEIQNEFLSLLNLAIDSIRNGKHRFLKENKKGLLEVTDPHATWMDARVDGVAVTPRIGALPEINALWFQARCLQWLWSDLADFSQIQDLGQSVLQIREEERPNMIFLHSIPLAPSFILQNWEKLEEDLINIGEKFWTPVGLRTLDPHHPNYHPSYIGIQKSRDAVYHQGPAWGWLGGQFEAARLRMLNYLDDLQPRTRAAKLASSESRANFSKYAHLFSNDFLQKMPIDGHIAELFDAEYPYAPRGAPAQAWSLACLEEATTRFNLKVDLRLSRAVTQRNQVAAKGLKTKKRQTRGDKNISR